MMDVVVVSMGSCGCGGIDDDIVDGSCISLLQVITNLVP